MTMVMITTINKQKYHIHINLFTYMITTTKFIIKILTIATIQVLAVVLAPSIFAQTPPLESPNVTTSEDSTSSSTLPASLGKVTIPITKSEQIIIDLPIKPDSKITIVPIK